MKHIILLLFIALYSLNAEETPIANPKYDAQLASKLGADKIGMKKYVMAFLKRGTVKIADSTERAMLQKAHMDNIGKLAESGKLIVAGPFLDNQDIRGIYIFNVESIVEAEELTNSDPAIKAGTLIMELHPWYGSAALIEIPEIHKRITTK